MSLYVLIFIIFINHTHRRCHHELFPFSTQTTVRNSFLRLTSTKYVYIGILVLPVFLFFNGIVGNFVQLFANY